MTRRRRLLLWSAPVALLLVAAVVKLASMTVASHSAATHFAARDVDGLRSDVRVLGYLDVIDPTRTALAEGSLAVLEGHLDEAERHFSEAAASGTCTALVNLTLVRETMGDELVADADGPGAIERYRAALTVVTGAPPDCFAGNDDPDLERRAARADSEARLKRKLAALEAPLPPLPPPAAAPPPPPPPAAPAPPVSGPASPDEDRIRQLDPRSGDPLERLQQLLEDAAADRGAP